MAGGTRSATVPAEPGDWVLFDGHVEVVTWYSRWCPVHDRRRIAAELLGERAWFSGCWPTAALLGS